MLKPELRNVYKNLFYNWTKRYMQPSRLGLLFLGQHNVVDLYVYASIRGEWRAFCRINDDRWGTFPLSHTRDLDGEAYYEAEHRAKLLYGIVIGDDYDDNAWEIWRHE
jgi:hypothetical protein